MILNMNLRNLTKKEMNDVVWRYMPFSKFISLLIYQALWFSKLNHLDDGFEGKIPSVTKKRMNQEHQEHKLTFNTPEFHRQIDSWNDENEESGRELIIANCWFIGDNESEKMWREYASLEEGVAIKSTPKLLAENVLMIQDNNITHIGRVKYVEHTNHEMSSYDGNQAIERAFIKDTEYEDEKELRLATMNWKTRYCVKPDGVQYTAEEVEGKGMNNFDNPGLYIGTKIDHLFTEVVISPNASDYFYNLVKKLIDLYGIKANVVRSSLAST